MEKSILKFETMTDTDLQEIQGGAFPLLIPVAVGFVKGFVYTGGAILTTRALLSGKQESAMKKILLGFAEGYFVVSIILYIATYLIMKNPINTLFYPETYPILLGLFYLGYKYKTKESTNGN